MMALNNYKMNCLRVVKKSKRGLKKITTQDQSPEEEAKQQLIELSNMWDFNHTHSNYDNHPQIILEQPTNNQRRISNKQFFHTERTPINRSYDIKRLTELLQEKPDVQRIDVRSERHYKYGDKFISISLRNPLNTSNYVMTGVSNKSKPSLSNPQRSQYIIRQQRNKNKIKREQLKRTGNSCMGNNLNEQPLMGGNSQYLGAKTSVFNSLLKSQQFTKRGSKIQFSCGKWKQNRTTQFLKTQK